MNSSITMNVSSINRDDEKKGAYVLFSDEGKEAEFMLPEIKIIRNEGFSQEELNQLSEYLDNSLDVVMEIAKNVNPIKGFMGKEQGK